MSLAIKPTLRANLNSSEGFSRRSYSSIPALAKDHVVIKDHPYFQDTTQQQANFEFSAGKGSQASDSSSQFMSKRSNAASKLMRSSYGGGVVNNQAFGRTGMSGHKISQSQSSRQLMTLKESEIGRSIYNMAPNAGHSKEGVTASMSMLPRVKKQESNELTKLVRMNTMADPGRDRYSTERSKTSFMKKSTQEPSSVSRAKTPGRLSQMNNLGHNTHRSVVESSPNGMKSKRSEILEYGIEGYVIGKPANLDNPRTHVQAWKNQKTVPNGKKTYLDDIIRESKKKLSPQIYAKQLNWKDRSQSPMLQGHQMKDVFRKGKRETLNEEVIRVAKSKHIPAPGAYNLPQPKIRCIPKQTVEQCVMIGAAQFQGTLAPPAKYDTSRGENLQRPTVFKMKIFPPKKKQENVNPKPIKSKLPDGGTYDQLAAFKKTQLNRAEQKVFIEKSPKRNFLDAVQKAKKFMPPPGHYKNIDAAYQRLSTSPPSIRTKRH